MANSVVLLLIELMVIITPTITTSSINDSHEIPTFRQIYMRVDTDKRNNANWSKEKIDVRIFSVDSILSLANEVGCYLSGKPCLPLCCEIGTFEKNRVCVRDKSGENARSPNYSSILFYNLTIAKSLQEESDNFEFAVSDFCKGNNASFFPKDDFYLMKNGSIYIPKNSNIKKMYDFNDYCLWRDYNSTKYIPKMCRNEIAINKRTPRSTTLESIGMIISIPFLLATFIVYTILPSLNNIHGQTLRGYVGCLVVAFTFLSILKNFSIISKWMCNLTGYTALFSSLASYFWLNIMCFDIWRTFGRSQTRQRNVDLSDREMYIIFSMYAWGCPILITATCLIIDQMPGIPRTVLRPGFGVKKCWFSTSESLMFYFYGPVGITFLANILMFTTTVIKMIRYRKNLARSLKGVDSKRHDNNGESSYQLYMKLFIVMGISWSMEIISWLNESRILWYLTDTANTLQGLTIFVVLVCTDKIKRLLAEHILGRNSQRDYRFQTNDANSSQSLGSNFDCHQGSKTPKHTQPSRC